MIEKIEEVFNCKVCNKIIKEEERCWIHEDKYCDDCINGDEELKLKIRQCEKDMLEHILGLLNEEGQKEIRESFPDYFDENKELIDIVTSTLCLEQPSSNIKAWNRSGPEPLIVKYVEHVKPE